MAGNLSPFEVIMAMDAMTTISATRDLAFEIDNSFNDFYVIANEPKVGEKRKRAVKDKRKAKKARVNEDPLFNYFVY